MSGLGRLIDRILSVVVAGAAVSIAVSAWGARAHVTGERVRARIEYQPEWHLALSASMPTSRVTAPVTIVEFVDLQCPSCAYLRGVLEEVMERFRDSVAVQLVNFPLEQHARARPGAMALVCADQQGAALSFADTVLKVRADPGSASWAVLAVHAGVADTAAFNACLQDKATGEAVDSARSIGERLRIAGTPTVYVNGWHLRGPLSAEFISLVVAALLSGKDPARAVASSGL